VRASVPEGLAPDEITIRRRSSCSRPRDKPRSRSARSPDGQFVYLRVGRFGPYVQLGEDPEDKEGPKPKRASLFKSMSRRR
jgi:DNA topoisomerase-1